MTKNELAKECYEICRNKAISSDCELLYSTIMEFFNSNVVRPKGENRHPYADVLHEFAEDVSKTIQLYQEYSKCWDDLRIDNTKFRIKPSESVWEYLWMELRTPDTYDIARTKYMTEEEAVEYFNDSMTYFAVQETKRERK